MTCLPYRVLEGWEVLAVDHKKTVETSPWTVASIFMATVTFSLKKVNKQSKNT